jgi:hypothetical protein
MTDTAATVVETPATTETTTAPSPDQARIAALEGQLAAVETALLADVPAHLKALVPASLPVGDRIGWLQNAKKAGLFAATTTVPTTDNTKIKLAPAPETFTTLPIAARLAAGYR